MKKNCYNCLHLYRSRRDVHYCFKHRCVITKDKAEKGCSMWEDNIPLFQRLMMKAYQYLLLLFLL